MSAQLRQGHGLLLKVWVCVSFCPKVALELRKEAQFECVVSPKFQAAGLGRLGHAGPSTLTRPAVLSRPPLVQRERKIQVKGVFKCGFCLVLDLTSPPSTQHISRLASPSQAHASHPPIHQWRGNKEGNKWEKHCTISSNSLSCVWGKSSWLTFHPSLPFILFLSTIHPYICMSLPPLTTNKHL